MVVVVRKGLSVMDADGLRRYTEVAGRWVRVESHRQLERTVAGWAEGGWPMAAAPAVEAQTFDQFMDTQEGIDWFMRPFVEQAIARGKSFSTGA